MLGLWSTATFAAVAATENEHGEAYNNTALVAGAFAVFGGTYTILRNEAYRLRLSDRTVRIEQAVLFHTSELRGQLESANAKLEEFRKARRDERIENAQQQYNAK